MLSAVEYGEREVLSACVCVCSSFCDCVPVSVRVRVHVCVPLEGQERHEGRWNSATWVLEQGFVAMKHHERVRDGRVRSSWTTNNSTLHGSTKCVRQSSESYLWGGEMVINHTSQLQNPKEMPLFLFCSYCLTLAVFAVLLSFFIPS